MTSPITVIASVKFSEVAKLAALQELNLRLLANKTKAIEDSAYEYHVAETEKKVVEHFSSLGQLKPDEIEQLSKSRQIRNKILHCEFNEAVKRIESLIGTKVPGPSAKLIKLDPNSSGEQILGKILQGHAAIVEGRKEGYQDASEMTDKDVGIFGGLVNCIQTGAMGIAIEIFKRSNVIIDRLMEVDTTIELKTPSS